MQLIWITDSQKKKTDSERENQDNKLRVQRGQHSNGAFSGQNFREVNRNFNRACHFYEKKIGDERLHEGHINFQETGGPKQGSLMKCFVQSELLCKSVLCYGRQSMCCHGYYGSHLFWQTYYLFSSETFPTLYIQWMSLLEILIHICVCVCVTLSIVVFLALPRSSHWYAVVMTTAWLM